MCDERDTVHDEIAKPMKTKGSRTATEALSITVDSSFPPSISPLV